LGRSYGSSASRGRNGQRWIQTVSSSLRGHFQRLLFSCKIRVLVWDFHVLVWFGHDLHCSSRDLDDSESFELELNGRAWDTSGLSFVQIRSVVLEIKFRPMYPVHLGEFRSDLSYLVNSHFSHRELSDLCSERGLVAQSLRPSTRCRCGNARGGAAGAAGGHAGRAGGRESAAHAARPAPSAAPSHARRSTLAAPGQDQLLRSGVGLCFGCELICRPNVLVICDRWLEDSCTGSSL
jgi:hypothetical protein